MLIAVGERMINRSITGDEEILRAWRAAPLANILGHPACLHGIDSFAKFDLTISLLLPGSGWDAFTAAWAARALADWAAREDARMVLFGRRVARAFVGENISFGEIVDVRGAQALILPHQNRLSTTTYRMKVAAWLRRFVETKEEHENTGNIRICKTLSKGDVQC
jgi:hypothetical protein